MSNRFTEFFDRFRPERKRGPDLEEVKFRAVLDSGYFDASWYAVRAGEVELDAPSGLKHYFETGWKNGLDPSPGFSTAGYLSANPEVALANINPLAHFVLIGKLQGRGPGIEADGTSTRDVVHLIEAEFDPKFYYRKNPDIARSGYSPLSHFVNLGWKQGRNPNQYFSTNYYLEQNADVRHARINPFYHFVAAGRREGRPPNPVIAADIHKAAVRKIVGPEFDASFYFRQNPHLRGTGMDPLDHYLETGWRNGSDPNPDFSVNMYLEKYPDVRNADVEPFFHFISEGRREGRSLVPEQNISVPEKPEERAVLEGEFDAEFYLLANPDVRRAGIDPLLHYVNNGWRELRDPSPKFSTKYYLDSNPDVSAAGVNPFFHYLLTGRAEGRKPQHPGGWKVRVLERQRSPKEQKEMDRSANAEASRKLKDAHPVLPAMTPVVGEQWVLSVSHDNYTESVGGIQHCIKLEQRAASERSWRYLNLFPTISGRYLAADENWREQSMGVVLDGQVLGNTSIEQILQWIEGVHASGGLFNFVIHSPLGHSIASLQAMHATAKPSHSIFWLHDYFSLCPSYTLLRNDIAYCAAPPPASLECSLCIYGDERLYQLKQFNTLFESCPFDIVSPSNVALEIWKTSSRMRNVRTIVHEHCTIRPTGDLQALRTTGPRRIAYVGHPADHKGWNCFVRLVNEFKDDGRYEFHHFGSTQTLSRGCHFTEVSVIRDGALAMQNALATAGIDAALIWSVWPETFSFVAHEALAAGASIITNAASGNVARLARDNPGNIVCTHEDELLESFRREDVVTILDIKSASGIPLSTQHFGSMSIDLLAARG